MIQHQQNTVLQSVFYQIAGLSLQIGFPKELNRQEILPSFEPFKVEPIVDEKIICSIELSFNQSSNHEDSGRLLSDVSVVWGENFRFSEQEESYITTIRSEPDGHLWKMRSSKKFSHSVIHMIPGEASICHVLSWLAMVAFGQACLQHRAVLIHASVVAHRGEGYAFLGKSGTGKSTHSRLWLEQVEGAELLNDDNPAIRLEEDGQVYVYGTPWSGKTACYKNIKVHLQTLVRLKQAAFNQLSWKEGVTALVCILPSCTAIRWNKQLFSEMTDTVEAIVQKVFVAELDCLPNQDAADLCYSEILKHTEKFNNN